MNRKWLAYSSVCILALALTLIFQAGGRAQSPAPPPPPPPALLDGAEAGWIASEPFEIFTEPLDPSAAGLPLPDPMAGDVFFFGADASTDIALAGPPEFAAFSAAVSFPPPDPQQGGAIAGGVSFVGPDPKDTITFVGFEAGLGNQVVTGAPYSATITSEFQQTLPDGNKIERKTTTAVYRDSQGRTRREQTLPAIGKYSASSNAPQAIFINDPVAGVSYVLDPARKTARQMPGPKMKFFAGGPERPARGAVAVGPGPGGPLPGKRLERAQDPNVTTESLGAQNIEGILVQGSRVTRTIPAGSVGNQNPIRVTSERWYSPDLMLNLSVKNTDPMRGTNSTTLSNIRRDEPSASLFQVPSDYTVKEPPNRMIMRGQRVDPPPAPQPQQ
jgi:hypothetical protein